jgi:UDP-N-acetylmuramate dehydrogenase
MPSDLQILENVDLAPMTTLKVGGAARFFARVMSESEIREAIDFSRERALPLFVLGGGSNLLVADTGFDGLVLQNGIRGVVEIARSESGDPSAVVLDVGAGEDWDAFVAKCVEGGLAGVECLSGIPGTVGATPIQNVGAYGQEVSETVVVIRCIDRSTGASVEVTNAEARFAYRTSAFNSSLSGKYVVTSIRFRLRLDGEPKLSYKDLHQRFAGSSPSLADVRSAVIAIRAAKSMVVDAADPNSQSAGSFFKNPIVSAEKLSEVRSKFSNVPAFASGDEYKIPAAWMIESAGIRKGYTLGRAGVSSNHSLAIINRGGATAAEIIVLRDEIRRRVVDKFGIDLHQEPIMLGFD